MTAVAAHQSLWGPRWRRAAFGAPHASATVGIPILETKFADLRLVVEIAWGSSYGPDPGRWTDITADLAAPVTITVGRADEASDTQPASVSLLLKSPGGRYFKGPQSPNWPNVKRGTPIRVRIILNGVSYTRFYGYAQEFTPTFDDARVNPRAQVAAFGILRRLNRPTMLRSAYYRSTALTASSNPNLLAYWPCEEGSVASQIASGLPGGPNMTLSAYPAFAQNSSFPSSAALPQLVGSIWSAALPAPGAGAGSDNTLLFMLSLPSTGEADGTVIARFYTKGTAARVDLVYTAASNGQLALRSYNAAGTQLAAVGPITLSAPHAGFNGWPVLIAMSLAADGSGNVAHTLGFMPLLSGYRFDFTSFPVGAFSANTSFLSSASTGVATQVVINPGGQLAQTAIGHITYQATGAITSLLAAAHAFNAWTLESATDRLARVCAEQGDPIDVAPGTGMMGYQSIDTYINILRAAELVDGGVLYDGAGPGLTYVPASARQNLTATLTLDVAAGHLIGPVQPVDDDQRIVNTYTATRTGGSTATFSDTTSPLSVNTIGPYPDGKTINCSNDFMLADFAAWKVHLGTVDAYRWPTLRMRFNKSPEILLGWLNTQITSRIDVANLAQVLPGLDPRPVSLIAEGWTETIDKLEWSAGVNTTSYDPWRIAHLAADVNDFSEGVLRPESDGSTNVGRAEIGANSLIISTPSGPLWTTDPAECPIELDIGGIHVTATAISGTSSPQTFTVSPVTMAIPDGAAVVIWNPGYLGR